jgi:uncharacterized protein YcbX
MQGERVTSIDVGPEGLDGDRRFALFDLDTGFGLTARRAPDLLYASARWTGGSVEITLPDGTRATDDAALSQWLGRRVQLRAAADDDSPRLYENPTKIRDDHDDEWEPFHGARGAFHDSPRSRVSLVSTASLRAWDERRFRANVVLDGEGEDAFVGTSITVGEVHLDVVKRIGRCVIVTRPQPDGIERDLDVLKRVNHDHDGCLGIGALVSRSGAIGAGDVLRPRD